MKLIKEILDETQDLPKCPRSGEINLYYLIQLFIKG